MSELDRYIDIAKYREELNYLIEYGKGHWVPFYPVQGGAEGTLVDREEDFWIDVTVRMISDLYDAGVRPVDLTATDDPPYVAWNLPKEEALDRIRGALEALEDSADALDICWFTYTG